MALEHGPARKALGGLMAVIGSGHAIAPWVFGYSDQTHLVVSDVISGLALVAFGLARANDAGAWTMAGSAVAAIWILAAPVLFGLSYRTFAANHALWIGVPVLMLSIAGYIAARFGGQRVVPIPAHG